MVLSFLLVLIATSAVSFLGSLQLGPVNLYVLNSVLYSGKKAAFWVAFGGVLPEFIYCALAVFAHEFIQQSILFQLVFKIIFIVILFVIGFVFLLQKAKAKANNLPFGHTDEKPVKYILKGFSLAAFNPQLLPFWLFVQIYFNSVDVLQIKSGLNKFSFILGSGLGAFVILTLLIFVVNKYKTIVLAYANNAYYFKALAILFFFIAIHQVITLLNTF